MHYEYESVQIRDDLDHLKLLNDRGSDGWVVCGVINMEASTIFYFMRPYTKPVE